jgi:hypothetical protein
MKSFIRLRQSKNREKYKTEYNMYKNCTKLVGGMALLFSTEHHDLELADQQTARLKH